MVLISSQHYYCLYVTLTVFGPIRKCHGQKGEKLKIDREAAPAKDLPCPKSRP